MIQRSFIESVISCEYEGNKYAVKTIRRIMNQSGQPVRVLGKVEKEFGVNYDGSSDVPESLIRYYEGSILGKKILVSPVEKDLEEKILNDLVRKTVH
ncbi:MAG: hypothetical protein KC506_02170 [Nanoarchaeota archaeon]|nr:hypothetical protein [Nanoarchaeota archaeon]